MRTAMLDMSHVLQAHQHIFPFIRQTPLVHSPYLSRRSGADVWLKLECRQPTGSFKVRGALYKLSRLSPEEKARGVVAASAGNHALGLAYAAQRHPELQVDIFVPVTAPRAKIDKLQQFDVTVHQVGRSYDQAHQAAERFVRENGGLEISAYDDPEIIAGQGTVGKEILNELPDADAILTPVGGGGLIAGVALVANTLSSTCQIIGVQPEASPAALLSLRDGVAYDPYHHEPTIADGLAGGFGKLPFQIVANLISNVLLVSEEMLRQAIYLLLHHDQLLVEPSGAIAIAPLLQRNVSWSGQTVVCILTGSNLDTSLLRDILVEYTVK